MSRRMGLGVSDSLGGAFPNKVYATLEIRACRVTVVHPLQGSLIYSNSRVHGNRTLYAEARAYYYKLLLLNCWFRFLFLIGKSRRGSRRHILLLIITTYYYTMLQQLLLHCYFHHCCIKLLADSYL